MKKYIKDTTAGITSNAAVDAIGNRYDLILVGARRIRELHRGDMPKIESEHNALITALLEIEAGKVDRSYLYKAQDVEPRKRFKGQY